MAAKLFKLIDRKSIIDPFSASGKRPLKIIGEIMLKNITFAYPVWLGIIVLNDFSIKFPVSKTTTFVIS